MPCRLTKGAPAHGGGAAHLDHISPCVVPSPARPLLLQTQVVVSNTLAAQVVAFASGTITADAFNAATTADALNAAVQVGFGWGRLASFVCGARVGGVGVKAGRAGEGRSKGAVRHPTAPPHSPRLPPSLESWM